MHGAIFVPLKSIDLRMAHGHGHGHGGEVRKLDFGADYATNAAVAVAVGVAVLSRLPAVPYPMPHG